MNLEINPLLFCAWLFSAWKITTIIDNYRFIDAEANRHLSTILIEEVKECVNNCWVTGQVAVVDVPSDLAGRHVLIAPVPLVDGVRGAHRS